MSEPSTILFVDDELAPAASNPGRRHYLWYYSLALREAGYRVIEVNTPDDALKALTEAPNIQLVLLDVMMKPGRALDSADTSEGLTTGLALARRLREIGVQAPIVALSQHSPSGIVHAFQKIPKCRLVFKEAYTPDMLADYIEKILDPEHR